MATAPVTTTSASEETALLLRMYRVAVLTRALDHHLWLLNRQGTALFVLTGRGQEIAQIASVAALRQGHDTAWLYYRDLAGALALGVTPYEILLGAFGKAGDPHSGGRQLTMHLSSPRLGIPTMSSEVAAHIPHAVGAAWAARVLGQDRVAMCWFGDGATSQGSAHEAMNLAAIHRLPVVFLCENNGLAISVPNRLQMPVEHAAERAAAYAMPGVTVDGTDAAAMLTVAREAVSRARHGHGPTLIEALVPRMVPHSCQDDESYRSAEELDAAAAADPLPRLRDDLVAGGALSEEEDALLWQEAREQVVADADLAVGEPQPAAERARLWLYGGGAPHQALQPPARRPGWNGVFGS